MEYEGSMMKAGIGTTKESDGYKPSIIDQLGKASALLGELEDKLVKLSERLSPIMAVELTKADGPRYKDEPTSNSVNSEVLSQVIHIQTNIVKIVAWVDTIEEAMQL